MLTQPFGVQQIFTSTAPGGVIVKTLIPVTCPNWKKFCMEADAQVFVKFMAQMAPGSTLTLTEGLLEESMMYVYDSLDPAASPRVWMIEGTLADGAVVGEYAGWLMDRATKPQPFIDNTNGNPPGAGNVLQVEEFYGYAQFLYAQPKA